MLVKYLRDYDFRNLSQYAFSTTGHPLSVWRFGIPFDGTPTHTFRMVAPKPLMEEYNHSMSSIKISVEWIFGDIINYFKLVCKLKKKR